MKTIPLFDNCLLDAHQDIAPRFAQAELCTDKLVCEDGDSAAFPGGFINLIRDPDNRRYKYCYVLSGQHRSGGDYSKVFRSHLESAGGFNWTRPDPGFAARQSFDEPLAGGI